MKQKVVVGLSGGVDSSVVAYLLQKQGYQVIGLFMKNWHDDSVTISDECPWLEDSNDALLVAEKLGIPFQTVDLSQQYKERIIDYMFNQYEQGRTPNPDVLCNREIKFDVFMKIAFTLGADFVATGHYCRKDTIQKNGKTIYRLLEGVDSNKDQSYFLCQLSQQQLAKSIFPLGDLTKPQVRRIALKIGLATAEKKDSQGLCFVGKVRLPEFLQQKLKPKTGFIYQISNESNIYNRKKTNFSSLEEELHFESEAIAYKPEDGKKIGTHNGAHYFTIGQRKGLNIGGTKEPLFVIATDTQTNSIYVGESNKHKGLFRKTLFVKHSEIHFLREDLTLKNGEYLQVIARIRYRQPLQKATIYRFESGLYVRFEQPQSAITQGQFVACYIDDELIASGVIN